MATYKMITANSMLKYIVVCNITFHVFMRQYRVQLIPPTVSFTYLIILEEIMISACIPIQQAYRIPCDTMEFLWICSDRVHVNISCPDPHQQGGGTPIPTVNTSVTGVKVRSRGQHYLLGAVKRSRQSRVFEVKGQGRSN